MTAAKSRSDFPPAPFNPQPLPPMILGTLLFAAAGYSLIYLLFGGGIGGAILIFIVAKLLGK